MDIKTHLIFSKKLLELCSLEKEYTTWGIAPDRVEKHHRWRHSFSNINWIYTTFEKSNVPSTDKNAISLCVVSHLYLDMFNAILPAFKFPPYFTINVPKGEIRELIKDLNFLTFSAPDEFYEEECHVFEDLKEGEACDYIPAMIISLADHTYPWKPNIKRRASKYLENFSGERIEIREDTVKEMRAFTVKYENFIKRWCAKI